MYTLDTIKDLILKIDRTPLLKGFLWSLYNSENYYEFSMIRSFLDKPIFIGGCGRSGTTLMLSLLSSQPGILAIPDETYAFAEFPEKVTGGNCSYKIGPQYVDQFLKFALLSARAVGADSTETLEKCRVVEKTPSNVHFYNHIAEYFDDNLFVLNIVRDGRDVVTSRHPSDPQSYYISPIRWIRAVQAGMASEEHQWGITIKYENLVNRTTEVLKRVCQHCGLKFDSDRLRGYPGTSQFKHNNAWFGEARPVSNKSVGRWKLPEHTDRVKMLTRRDAAKDLLSKYGYL